MMDDGRDASFMVPPHSLACEQSAIGGILLAGGEALDRVQLRVDDFYSDQHRAIYARCVALNEAAKPIDVLTVSEALNATGELERAGGQAYLGSLSINTPSAANIRRYAEIVRDKAMLRRLIAAATDVQSKAYDPGADPKAVAEAAESAFMGVQRMDGDSHVATFAKAIGEALDARDAPQRGISTGYANLDGMLKGGIRPGQLIVIAARASMGKTTLAQNIAENVAKSRQVLFHSLEMSRQELAERSLAHHEAEVGLSDALAHTMRLNLTIDEAPAVTVAHVRMRARRVKRKHGLSLIVMDYLQLMSGKGENRTQEIGSISRGLKALAKELEVPVIAVAQINRAVEQRPDKRPMLSDLRESGDIEADADVVMMVYRDDYYTKPAEESGLAEIIVRKNRNGRTGTCHMRFDAEHARFSEWQGEIPSPSPAPRARAVGTIYKPDFRSRAAGDE